MDSKKEKEEQSLKADVKVEAKTKNKRSRKREKAPTKRLEIVPIKMKEEEDVAPKNSMYDAKIIPNHPARVMFVGASNSGKTTLALNLLKNEAYFRRYFDVIHVFSPTYHLDRAWRPLDEWTKDNRKEKSTDSLLIPHTEYDMDDLQKICDGQKQMVLELGRAHTKVLFLFDDSIGNNELMNNKNFLQLFFSGRHANASVWICTQKYNRVPLAARTQVSNLFIFKCNNKECKSLSEDWDAGLESKVFKRILNFCTDEDHGFCHINMQTQPRQWFRKGLNELIALPEV